MMRKRHKNTNTNSNQKKKKKNGRTKTRRRKKTTKKRKRNNQPHRVKSLDKSITLKLPKTRDSVHNGRKRKLDKIQFECGIPCMPCLRVFSCIKKNMGILEFRGSTSMIRITTATRKSINSKTKTRRKKTTTKKSKSDWLVGTPDN